VKRHPDEIACRECGATFNLAFQEYYDNRCPDCVDE
jgi:DNA-directed RNA polymerase subunit RPC12/RpoP